MEQGEQQLTNRIPALLESWEDFQHTLDEMCQWVEFKEAELASLRHFPEFLLEFDSLQSRLKVAQNLLQFKNTQPPPPPLPTPRC